MGFFSSIGDFVKDSFGGIVGAAGKIVGGLIGADSQKDVNAENTAFAREQLQFQKDYIQNRLQWQVEDAKKAGLHPMVAAGISPTSFSPVSLGNSPIDSDWIGEAGQSIAYASAKAKDRKQQQEAWNFTKEMNEAQIDGVRLDNELKVMQLMSQLALLNQTGPSAPEVNATNPTQDGGGADGQPDSGNLHLDKPIVRDGWLLDEYGRKVGIIPSDPAAQRFEDKLILEWIPFVGSSVRAFRGKYLGQKVNGHWWHGEDKGFLPYPPKKEKGFLGHASDVVNFYSHYGD